MIEAGFCRSLTNRKLLLIQNTDNIGCQLGFELFNIGILITKILKDVTTTFDDFQFIFHLVGFTVNVKTATRPYRPTSLPAKISCSPML